MVGISLHCRFGRRVIYVRTNSDKNAEVLHASRCLGGALRLWPAKNVIDQASAAYNVAAICHCCSGILHWLFCLYIRGKLNKILIFILLGQRQNIKLGTHKARKTTNDSHCTVNHLAQPPTKFMSFISRPRRSNRTNRKGAWSYSIGLLRDFKLSCTNTTNNGCSLEWPTIK